MTMTDLLFTALESLNEILAAGIVIIAISLLLYNLTRNLNNRVARTSGAVLASVTFAYLVDVYLSLGPSRETALIVARFQWLGIALIPSTLFHLSDALLATTGLPSRGRRRLTVRLLYLISMVFFMSATLTNWMTVPVFIGDSIHMTSTIFSLFPVYVIFFIVICSATFINLNRARQRCLTVGSKRRMAYLQFAILTPALGIFPYSALLSTSYDMTWLVQLLVNLTNVIVIIMLVFLSYPLSFFGSDNPNRVVKVELLRFLLRGPGTALLVLGGIVATDRASSIKIMSLSADDFLPFGVIAIVLLWQWSIHLSLPYLEKWLVYADEDDEQLQKLQDLSDKMLTKGDLLQWLKIMLEALCDYLQVELAFVLTLNGKTELIQSTQDMTALDMDWTNQHQALVDLANASERVTNRSTFQNWQSWYMVPLYSNRSNNTDDAFVLIGILGIQTPDDPLKLVDERDMNILYSYVNRIEQTLDDLLLQQEVFAALEGLLPQISTTRGRDDGVEYKRNGQSFSSKSTLDAEELYEQVRAALRHYWGGPGISRSRLLDLAIINQAREDADSSIQALRNLLQMAMERMQPESERSLTATEWTLYNILDLRFIQGKKVRDVARRMSISEPDLYRKQRLAIEELSRIIKEMETFYIRSVS